MADRHPENAGEKPVARDLTRPTKRKIIRRKVGADRRGGDAPDAGSTAAAPTAVGGDDRRAVFVAMPFRKAYDPVFAVVQQAADRVGMVARRVDQDSFTGSILSHMRNAIASAQYMVAIASEENGNVYYEIGLAHCQKKPVILLTSDPSP